LLRDREIVVKIFDERGPRYVNRCRATLVVALLFHLRTELFTFCYNLDYTIDDLSSCFGRNCLYCREFLHSQHFIAVPSEVLTGVVMR